MTLAQIESLRSLESDWLASPDATKESRRREYQSALLASAGELMALAEAALHTQASLAMPIDRRARLRKLRMQYSPTRGKVPT